MRWAGVFFAGWGLLSVLVAALWNAGMSARARVVRARGWRARRAVLRRRVPLLAVDAVEWSFAEEVGAP